MAKDNSFLRDVLERLVAVAPDPDGETIWVKLGPPPIVVEGEIAAKVDAMTAPGKRAVQ